MFDNTKVVVRIARDQDIPAVTEISAETLSPHGTAQKPERFQLLLRAFPNGFVILVAENEIAAYGCSEKRLTESELGVDENPVKTHDPDGRILFITDLAVKTKYRGRGYRLRVLDKLIEIAPGEGCRQIVVATANAQDLYLQRGFQTVQSHTEGGVSMDVMSLELKHSQMISGKVP